MNVYEPIKLLSDGDKIIIIQDGKSFALEGAVLTRFDYQVERQMTDITMFGDYTKQMVAGLSFTTLNLSISGGMLSISDKTDTIDLAKVEKYAKKINQEVKEIALKRALEF